MSNYCLLSSLIKDTCNCRMATFEKLKFYTNKSDREFSKTILLLVVLKINHVHLVS